MPVRNPANQVWIDAIAARAAAEPGRVMLTGGMGNASFSPDRDDVFAALVRQRQWRTVADTVRARAAGDAMPWPLVVRHHVLPPLAPGALRRWRRRRRDAAHGTVDLLRPEWHERLVRTGSVWPVIARRTQAGRLPDEVRLRTQRGSQAPDWAAWLAPQRDAIGDRLADMARSPMLTDLVDLPRAQRLVDDWPEQFTYAHTVDYDLALSRALVIGAFVRWWERGGPDGRHGGGAG